MNAIKTLSPRIKELLATLFVFACSFCNSLFATANPFQTNNIGYDSGVFQYIGKVILNGGMPYRDAFDHKGPLIYLINALGIFINKKFGVWILELIAIFITFYLAYRITLLIGGTRLIGCVVVFLSVGVLVSFEIGNLTEEYAMPFISGALYIFILFYKNGSIKAYQAILCGLCLGAVCLLRINMIGLWIVFCIGIVFYLIKNKQAVRIIKYGLQFFAGFLMIVLPIMIWLYANNSFEPFVEDYFLFNFVYTSNSTYSATIDNKLSSFSFFINNAMVLGSCCVFFYFGIAKKKIVYTLCAVCMVMNTLLTCISGKTYPHYYLVYLPLILLAFLVLLIYSTENTDKRRIVALAASLGFFVIVVMGNRYFELAKTIGRQVLGLYNPVNEIEEIVSSIQDNSEEDDLISVFSDDMLYVLSDRFSVSKYSYQLPIIYINQGFENEYFQDITTKKPKLIVVSNNTNPNYEYLFERLRTTVESNYSVIDTENEYFRIYKLNEE